MTLKNYPLWVFGVLLKLNSISITDCNKWVDAIYRAGANYCVLELAENTSDELIEHFAVSCRKRKMYVGLYSRSIEEKRIEHLLSKFGRIDYLMLDEAAEGSEELRKMIFSLAPHIYLRGAKSLRPNVIKARDLVKGGSEEEAAKRSTIDEEEAFARHDIIGEEQHKYYEYDYDMAVVRPLHEEEIVINSSENIIRIYKSVAAEGMNFLLYVSVIRTHNQYAAEMQCLNDLGSKLAPNRQKLRISKRAWMVTAAVLLLLFCLARTLYVSRVFGQYQRKLGGHQARMVAESVGKYGYTVMAPGFLRFRGGSSGLYYAVNGPLKKVNGDSLNIYVKVTPYLIKSVDYEVYISVIPDISREDLPKQGRGSYLLILDNELKPLPETDYEALKVYEKYYEDIYEQIRDGNDFFGIE